jgi:hypothetical protein
MREVVQEMDTPVGLDLGGWGLTSCSKSMEFMVGSGFWTYPVACGWEWLGVAQYLVFWFWVIFLVVMIGRGGWLFSGWCMRRLR